METTERLNKLGLYKAALKVETDKKVYGKVAIAEEHYNSITKKDIEVYDRMLKRKTSYNGHDGFMHYELLYFQDIGSYPEVPSVDVLDKLEKAKELNVFARFSVGRIIEEQTAIPKRDPILIASVEGGKDKVFLIAQWGNDVTLEAIKEAAKEK